MNRQIDISEMMTSRPEMASLKIGVAPDDFERIAVVNWPAEIELIVLEPKKGRLCLRSARSVVALSSLPVRLIGFVTASQKGLAQIKTVRKVWSDQFKSEAPEIFEIADTADATSLFRWLVGCLAAENKVMAQRNVVLMRSMAMVRAVHEDTQEAFHRLERFAEKTFSLERVMAISLDPQTALISLGRGNACLLTQRLPISSVGVSDVALHVAAPPRALTGILQVTLHTLEDDELVGTWSVAARSLRCGWLRLSLKKCLGVDERSLALKAEWQGGDGLSLSLSVPHPETRWCATFGQESASRVLAVKIWRGLPDTNPAAPAVSVSEVGISAQIWDVPEEVLCEVENITAPEKHVLYVKDNNQILVHPLNQTPSIAFLSRACPVGAKHVWAEVETVNSATSVVEFALAVALSDGTKRKFGVSQFTDGYFSDWVRVGPGERSQVHLFLPAALAEAADLYLATRIDSGASNENCRAHFGKIRITD